MNETGFNLIPLFFFVVITGILIFLLVRVILPWMSQRITWKRNVLGIGLYLAILTMLVPLTYLLPRQGFLQPSRDESQMALVSPEVVVGLFSSVKNPDQLQGVIKNNSQTFKLNEDSLTLDEFGNRGDYHVFIKRKDRDDGEIEVSTYIPEQLIGGFDSAKGVLPPEILLRNGRLVINPPEHQNLEFKRFMADFTVDQFKHLNQESLDIYKASFLWKAIYIKVPQNLTIDYSKGSNVHVLNTTSEESAK
jgi:hypothetical protein